MADVGDIGSLGWGTHAVRAAHCIQSGQIFTLKLPYETITAKSFTFFNKVASRSPKYQPTMTTTSMIDTTNDPENSLAAINVQPLTKASVAKAVLMPGIGDIEDGYTLPCPSVNYHVTRQCNYRCRFCFHRAQPGASARVRGNRLPPDEIASGLRLLVEAGARKLNIAGGEPTLLKDSALLGLIACAKAVGFESVSLITNAHRLGPDTVPRLKDAGLDILGFSLHAPTDQGCEELGFYHASNERKPVGQRAVGTIQHMTDVAMAAHACGLRLKVNTTLCVPNGRHLAQLADFVINTLRPCRWKIFQAIPLGSHEREGVGKCRVGDEERRLFMDEAEYDAAVDPVVGRHGGGGCHPTSSRRAPRPC